MRQCIACGGRLYDKPIMVMDHMPSSAQNIPTIQQQMDDHEVTLNLCECSCCGLVQLDTEPVNYYRDVIRAGGISTTMRQLRMHQYDTWIKECSLKGAKIIEVGCGAGEFLRILAEYPVDAFGLEHMHSLVEKAVQSGLRVYEGYPETEDYEMEGGPYDAFTSFNYLEHQPQPTTYLRAIAHNVTDGGYGLITVPSFEYILEQKSYYEFIADHIAYYTEDTLRTVLNISGWDVVSMERINRDTISAIVKKKKRAEISALIEELDSIRKEVERFIESNRDSGRKVAIWGAGHQGFTLCSSMGLSDQVRYIIDSAKFKQGKVAPVSHIPIISPEEALEDPVDVIIIVAPGYTEEIADIIRQSYKKDIHIYTLRTNHIEKIV